MGRYQLFQGEYKFVNVKGEQYWENALLKIDTATGQVWMGEEWQYKDPETGKLIQDRRWDRFEEKLELEMPMGK